MPGPFGDRFRRQRQLLAADGVSAPTVYGADAQAIVFTDDEGRAWTAWLRSGQIIGYDHGFLLAPELAVAKAKAAIEGGKAA